MIYTVTFSPALDYIVDLDEFVIGSINRTQKETILPGGKGINVSIVLSNLSFTFHIFVTAIIYYHPLTFFSVVEDKLALNLKQNLVFDVVME